MAEVLPSLADSDLRGMTALLCLVINETRYVGEITRTIKLHIWFFEICGVRIRMDKKERGERLQDEAELQNVQGKDGEH
jgi:hypothetical protein